MNSARKELKRVLRSGKIIFGQISVVLSLGLDSDENGSFAYLYKNEIRTLFSLIRKKRDLQ